MTTWANSCSLPILENVPNSILYQPLWNNKYIKIPRQIINTEGLRKRGFYYIRDLLTEDLLFTWENAKIMGFQDCEHFQWFSIINCIPSQWKKKLGKMGNPVSSSSQFDVTTIFINNQQREIGKIKQKTIYWDIVKCKIEPPTSQKTMEKRLNKPNINWEQVYDRIYRTTINTYMRAFQYKLINNILFLNRDLFRFKLVNSPLCSFCKSSMETADHIFAECIETKNLYFEIRISFEQYNIYLPEANPINIILGVERSENNELINVIVLIYKIVIYKARNSGKVPTLPLFLNSLKQYETLEKKCARDGRNLAFHFMKWDKLQNILNSPWPQKILFD